MRLAWAYLQVVHAAPLQKVVLRHDAVAVEVKVLEWVRLRVRLRLRLRLRLRVKS